MKKTFTAYALLGVLAASTLGPVVAFAQQNAPAIPRQAQTQKASLRGSIPVPENQNLSEADELAQYRLLATVTLDEAAAAAQRATGLSEDPTQVDLGDEDGFLVWEVVIGDQEVKVDAGNGQVLETEQVGAEDKDNENGEEDENEADEAREDENEAGEEGTENSD